MLDKIVDELVGVRPLKLFPILAVVLSQEDEDGAENVFDVRGIDVAATDALQGGTVGFKLGGQGPRANGADADPAAGSTYVEHAAEYFSIQIIGAEEGNCVVDMSAGAEKGGEVEWRTEGRIEGELESDAFEDLSGERGEGRDMGVHEEREGGEGEVSEGLDGANMNGLYGNAIQTFNYCFL
jgi:hypothetical protein